jgi:hypothetical protein
MMPLSGIAPRVSSIGLEPDMSLSCLLLVTGSTLLIPPGQGPIIRADSLPHLPSMDHGEVFRGFSASTFPRKKTPKQSADSKREAIKLILHFIGKAFKDTAY